jgi:hypothetical protein
VTITPPHYTGLELDVMRAGFALAVLWSLDGLRIFGAQGGRTRPVGLARWVDLRWLAGRWQLLQTGTYVALLAYVLDRAVPWALLYLALFLVLQVTAVSSDGSVNHGDHLVTIVAVSQLAAVVLWNATGGEDDLGGWLGPSQASTAAWWSVQAIVAVYFTSGLTKAVDTRGRWIRQSPGLLVAAVARLETAGAMGAGHHERRAGRAARLIDLLVVRPGIARAVFGAGLLVELVAPLALLGDEPRAAVGVALLALHAANGLVLLLPFPTYQVLVLAYLVNVPQLWAGT